MASRDRRYLFWVILILALVVDQLVKLWARHVFDNGNLANMNSLPWPGVFEFTLTYNRGIAFGMMQGRGVLMAPIAILMAGGAAFYSFKHPKDPPLYHTALSLLAAGALGNLFDRLVWGKVTDMFYFRTINFPVFNIADACITFAAGIMIYLWTLEALRKPKVASADLSAHPVE